MPTSAATRAALNVIATALGDRDFERDLEENLEDMADEGELSTVALDDASAAVKAILAELMKKLGEAADDPRRVAVIIDLPQEA
jgi:hypothetical protein